MRMPIRPPANRIFRHNKFHKFIPHKFWIGPLTELEDDVANAIQIQFEANIRQMHTIAPKKPWRRGIDRHRHYFVLGKLFRAQPTPAIDALSLRVDHLVRNTCAVPSEAR